MTPNPNPNPRTLPANATRVTLTRTVERYPHFTVPAGSTGTVDTSEWEGNGWIQVKWDDQIDGAEEWDNCLVLSPEDGFDFLPDPDVDHSESMALMFWDMFVPEDDDNGLGIESRNRKRATRALLTLESFQPGFQMCGMDDRHMHAADLITNILHAVRVLDIGEGIDPIDIADNCANLWNRAWDNFDAEAIHPDDLA